jgi:hypothetical protein
MMFKPLLLFLFLTSSVVSFSQSEKIKKHETDDGSIDRKGIIFGAHLSKYPTLEFGYSKYFYSTENTKMPFAGGYAISIENYFDRDYIMTPKISCWANFLFINFGASVPWYTDLKGGNSLKIRPEIGFGDKNWRVNFAYNIPLYNNGLNHITQAMLSFNYIIPISKAE